MGPETSRRRRPLSGSPADTRLHFVVTDLEIGGTPRVVRDLAIRLRSFGFDTRVTCLAPWGPVADELKAAGVPVSAAGVIRTAQLPAAVRFVRHATADADVIYSLLVHANVVSSLANVGRAIPLVQSIQTTQPRPGWHWWLQAWAARCAMRVIVPSPSVAAVAVDRSAVPPSQINVIPNAVDAVSRSPKPFDAAKPRVGFIGRLDPIKNVPDLVAAVARLEGVRLLVFGDGADRQKIRESIKAFDVSDRVTMHGTTGSAAEAFGSIDMLVLPSSAEGFGLVLIEAMAAGVPVIGTNVPGIQDVIRHGKNGLLVPVRSPIALADAIAFIRDDRDLRDRLITGGHRSVLERFGWPAVLSSYSHTFRSVMRKPISAAAE